MPAATTAAVQNKAAPVNAIFQIKESINFASFISQIQAKPANIYQIETVAENNYPITQEKGDPCFLIPAATLSGHHGNKLLLLIQ